MKFIIALILTALLSFAACIYWPWWSIAIVSAIVALVVPQRAFKAFLAGFLGVFLLWAILSYLRSSANGHILAHKISQLILKMDNPILLVVATGLIGGLVAGFAAMAGSYLRRNKPATA